MAPNYSQPKVDTVREGLISYAGRKNDGGVYQVPAATLDKIPNADTPIDNRWEENDYVPNSYHDLASKNSRASLASTSRRSSAAPSIFSSAGLRISTASTVYSRYSVRQHSLDSADPSSSATPWTSEKCDDRLNTDDEYTRRYFCTFCDAMFGCRVQWRDHELKDHETPEEHLCSICRDSFPERPSLASHRREVHNLSTPLTSEHIVKRPTRGAWGCGFCGAFVQSRLDYLDHIGKHCDEGMQRVHWQHSSVIRGLLKQPKIAEAWNRLVSDQERERATKLHFTWDEQTTGRQCPKEVDSHDSSRLQDILEFFANSSSDAQSIAQHALNVAQIRSEQNVSSLIKTYYPSTLRPLPESPDDITSSLVGGMGGLNLDDSSDQITGKNPAISVPTDSPPTTESSTQTVFTATFPSHTTAAESLFASWDPYLRTESNNHETDIPPHSTSHFNTTESAPMPVTETRIFSHLKRASPPVGKGLRRIDSDRHLDALQSGAAPMPRGEDIERPRTALASDYAKGPTTVSAELDVEASHKPSSSNVLLELGPGHNVIRKDWLLVPKGSCSSIGSPSVSSIHSSNARNRFLTPDDSTSERVSEDSFSDPDIFAEHDISNDTSRAWSKAYQLAISAVLQGLWLQYNQNWEALIRSCVGSVGSNNADRADPYRAGKATPSRRRPGGTLRPPSSRRTPDDDDDDDEDDGSQPSPHASRPGSAASKRFACPFRKHNPEKYNRVDYDICANKDWPTIPRLK